MLQEFSLSFLKAKILTIFIIFSILCTFACINVQAGVIHDERESNKETIAADSAAQLSSNSTTFTNGATHAEAALKVQEVEKKITKLLPQQAVEKGNDLKPSAAAPLVLSRLVDDFQDNEHGAQQQLSAVGIGSAAAAAVAEVEEDAAQSLNADMLQAEAVAISTKNAAALAQQSSAAMRMTTENNATALQALEDVEMHSNTQQEQPNNSEVQRLLLKLEKPTVMPFSTSSTTSTITPITMMANGRVEATSMNILSTTLPATVAPQMHTPTNSKSAIVVQNLNTTIDTNSEQFKHADESNEIVLLQTTTTTAATSVGNSEKRAKFINDNSTNAHKMNLPDGAEVWTLAGMKAIPATLLNGTKSRIYYESSEPSLLQNNSDIASHSEKNLLDWTQIMLNNDLNVSNNLSLTLDNRTTEAVVKSTLDMTDVTNSISITEAMKHTKVEQTTAAAMQDKHENALGNYTTISPIQLMATLDKVTNVTPHIKQNITENYLSADKHDNTDKNATLSKEQTEHVVSVSMLNATLAAEPESETETSQLLSLNSTLVTTTAATVTVTTTTILTTPATTTTNVPATITTSNAMTVPPTITTTTKTSAILKAQHESSLMSSTTANITTSEVVTMNGNKNANNENDDNDNAANANEHNDDDEVRAADDDDNDDDDAAAARNISVERASSETPTISTRANVNANVSKASANDTQFAHEQKNILQSEKINFVALETSNNNSNNNSATNIKETAAETNNSATIIKQETPAAEQIIVDLKRNDTKQLEPTTSFATSAATNSSLLINVTSVTTTPTTTTTAATTIRTEVTTTPNLALNTTQSITTNFVSQQATTPPTSLQYNNSETVELQTFAKNASSNASDILLKLKDEQQLNSTAYAHDSESSIETNVIEQPLNNAAQNPIATTTTTTNITANLKDNNKQEIATKVSLQQNALNELEATKHEDMSEFATTMSNLNISTDSTIDSTATTNISLLDDINNTTSKITTTAAPASIATKIADIYSVISDTTTTTTTENTIISTTSAAIITTTLNNSQLEEASSASTTTMLPPPTIATNLTQTQRAGAVAAVATTTHLPDITINNNLHPNSADASETDINVIIAISVSVIGVVALILLVAFLYLMRKRQKQMSYGQRCRPVSLDAYSLDNVSVLGSVRRKGALRASKRSYGNAAFDDPSLRHNLLTASELSKFIERRSIIFEEFREVPQITARPEEVPQGCEDKNRYANVIPLPETRVILQQQNDDERTEYINANYVRGPKDVPNYYIACQAPLEATVADFWRMIWEQQSRVIIQATDLVENGIDKCAEYLPPSVTLDNHNTYGDFQVTLKNRDVKDKYAISTLMLRNINNDASRELTHYWYKWPETGVPGEETPIIAMLLEARSSLKSYAIEQANELKAEKTNNSTSSLKVSDINEEEERDNDVVSGVSSGTVSPQQNAAIDAGRSSSNGEINGNITKDKLRAVGRNQGPLTIHCSPGTGRTGTIIACDMAIRSLETPKRSVDIPHIVYYVRRGRASAVQTKEQYEFIYKVANVYGTKITNFSNDN